MSDEEILDKILVTTGEFYPNDVLHNNILKAMQAAREDERKVLSADNAGWQTCPHCNGEGEGREYMPLSTSMFQTCTVCNGKKIISRATGKPPGE